MSTSLESDSQLADEIRRGNGAAFDRLFRKYYSPLCDFVMRIVKSHDATEDIVQEVFARLWIDRSDWIPEISVRAYLHKAVRNTALNYLKHLQVITSWSSKQPETYSNDVVEEVANRELLSALQEAIEQLPDGSRTIFLLSREEGLTYTEIADVLNISKKTVETQMGRALKTLRRHVLEPAVKPRY
jgi:RNA polymerase sigma-70 factor (ECF subfamily)